MNQHFLPRRRIRAVFLLSSILIGLLAISVSTGFAAQSNDLFFSEYIEGSSYNKALEIYNGTGNPVDLDAGDYEIHIFFNGNTSPSNTIDLSGSITDGDVFVVADDAALVSAGGLIPDAVVDLAASGNFFNGDDAVVLFKNGIVVDSFGQVGTDPGSQWTGGGKDDTLVRNPDICAGDTDETDAFDASLEWAIFPQNTFSDLGSHTANCASSGATDLFFSEYIEGSSYNKALEIYNGTGNLIDLDAGDYEIHIFFNGNLSPSNTIDLSGSITDGDVFVVADDAALVSAGGLIPDAVVDLAASGNFFNGDDAVILFKNGIVVDAFGQVGTDPGSQWAGGGKDDTLVRNPDICEGDTNETDAFDASLEWAIFSQNTFSDLGSHTATCSGGPAPVIDTFITVKPGQLNGWLSGAETGTGSLDFVAGPGTVLAGDGSAQFILDDAISGVAFGTAQFAGVRLDEISELSYSTYNTVGNGTVAPALQFNIDYDLTDSNAGWQGRLVFEPYFSGVPVVDGTWQTWDTLAGNWWSTGNPVVGDAPVAQSCSQASTCDLATLLSLYPNAGASSALLFKAGSGWFAGYQGSVDNFVIQVNNERTTFDFEPFILTLIHDIQGTADVSPLDGTTVNVRAVVVGDFQETNELDGFYIQEEDSDTDGDAQTSEGIFVYCGGGATCPDVSVGNIVAVTGNVDENYNQTQLDNDSGNLSVVIDDASNKLALATPAQISFPVANVSDLEAVESMSVQVLTGMHAVEYFNFDRYSEIRVWNDGSGADRPYQFTQNNLPDVAGSQAAQDLFNRSSILLDDASGVQGSGKVFPQHAGFPIFGDNSFNPGNPSAGFRGGDLFSNIEGVMAYSFSQYRIHISDLSAGTAPDGAPFDITISNTNPRSASPDDVGGNVTVASFNVLNYFTTIDTGANICGGNANLGCRGADNANEFARQHDNLVQALAALDTDIVGLIEIENTLGVSAEQTLVDALNLVSSRTYNYINTGTIGTDAIKVALIYDVNTISPVGSFAILDSNIDPTFIDTKNRPVLIQTFAENATGGVFTVAVNHFKSKGSSCASIGDPDTVNGQGNCSGTRTAAAIALANYLATDPTNSGDADFLIIGDLNSYAMEDPITALAGAGYTDLVQSFNGSSAYGYVFSGQWGTLDYALANSTLSSQVTGVTEWHVNADEPDAIDYDDNYNPSAWYQADGYRASDHDPVIIGFNLEAPPTATLFDISPAPLFAGENATLAFINVSDPNDPDLLDNYTYAIDCTTDGTPDAVLVGAGTGVTLPCSYPGAGTYGATGMIRDETGLVSNTNMVVITVISTEDAFAVVQTYIDGMDGLNNGQRNALSNHLTNALRQYSRANLNPTLAQLNALYDQVQDFAADGVISEIVRMELSDYVLRLIVSVTS